MIYYYLLVVFIFLLWLIMHVFANLNKKDVFLNMAFIILFLFLALRAENVGTDLKNYKEFFNLCSNISLSESLKSFEPFFVLYTYFISNVCGTSFSVYLFITAFISLIGPYSFIKNNSKDKFFSLLIYICFNFYIFAFSGLRQAIALSIIMYSIKYIKRGKLFKFLLCMLGASLFHKTAIVFIPAYFANKIVIKEKFIPIILGIFGFVYVFRDSIVSFIMNFAYDNYEDMANVNDGHIMLIIYIIMFLLFTFYKQTLLKGNDLNNLWYNLFIGSIVFQIIAAVQGNAYRLTYYYNSCLMILIPSFINCFNKEHRIIAKGLCFIALLVYFVISIESSTLVGAYEFGGFN